MRRALLHWSVGTAWLALAWSIVCAGLHVAWALGATLGRPSAVSGTGAVAYEILLAAGCVALGVTALLLAVGVPGGLGALAYSTARLTGVLLVLRGLLGVVQVLWDVAAGSPIGAGAAWPPWLLLGGLLFLGAGPWPRSAPAPAGARRLARRR